MKKSPKGYYILGANGECGPIPWAKLRLWLAVNWVPKEIVLRDACSQKTCRAADVDKLWKISNRAFIAEDPSAGLASAKFPASVALRNYLIENFHWPCPLSHLNYHNANSLRIQLEGLFPDPNRQLFYDKDWPSCWSWRSPAEEFIKDQKYRSELITERQIAVLRFFGKEAGIRTKGRASDMIEKLFSDPQKVELWEAQKKSKFSSIPATEGQMRRLIFACKKRGHKLPERISKYEASKLIEKWYGNSPKLEDAYAEYKLGLELETLLTPIFTKRKRKSQAGCLSSIACLLSVIAAFGAFALFH